MIFRNFISILIIFLLTGCNHFDHGKKIIINKNDTNKKTTEIKIKKNEDNNTDESIKFDGLQKYSNSGFALVYEENLLKNKSISKKIDNDALLIFHKSLNKNSFVKITNPANDESVVARVISNNVKFSDFYNSVITSRIARDLSLNIKEPYVKLVLVSNSSTFIAKKAKTFDEEKNVAEKAPVSKITIDDLGTTIKKVKIINNQSFLYSIKVADFYYKYSAENMIKRIETETNLKNYVIKKLSKTKYRVLLGPFNDIKKLEDSFNEMKSLNFENLEILKNV
tara:strand:+ start:437 stop:1279 length:843 start_codon:yes stop_codon:yes gene_type:complete